MWLSPSKLREPLLIALHSRTWSSIGSAAARSIASCSWLLMDMAAS
jgi:hypothetical protein